MATPVEVEEVRETLGADAFSGKPTSLAARSPVTMSTRRLKVLLGIAAALLVVFVVTRFLPEGKGSGTVLAFKMAEGNSIDYHMRMSMDGTLSVDGVGSRPFSVEVGGDANMKVASVDTNGLATINVTVAKPYAKVDPRPITPLTLPSVIKSQMQLGADGKVVSGGFGLAAATAGQNAPPGWDETFPVLPPDGVEPGDSWSEEVSVPFVGGQTIDYKVEYMLLEVKQQDGGVVAVISAQSTVPLDVTIKASEMAASDPTASPSAFPPGVDPTLEFGGEMTADSTYWVNTTTGLLDGTLTLGTLNMTTDIKDLPASSGTDHLSFRMQGKVTVSVQRAKPKASTTSGDASPAAKAS